jgi:hypothetical protein
MPPKRKPSCTPHAAAAATGPRTWYDQIWFCVLSLSLSLSLSFSLFLSLGVLFLPLTVLHIVYFFLGTVSFCKILSCIGCGLSLEKMQGGWHPLPNYAHAAVRLVVLNAATDHIAVLNLIDLAGSTVAFACC